LNGIEFQLQLVVTGCDAEKIGLAGKTMPKSVTLVNACNVSRLAKNGNQF